MLFLGRDRGSFARDEPLLHDIQSQVDLLADPDVEQLESPVSPAQSKATAYICSQCHQEQYRLTLQPGPFTSAVPIEEPPPSYSMVSSESGDDL